MAKQKTCTDSNGEQNVTELLRERARAYFERGIADVAVRQKKPLMEWAQWQTRKQTNKEFESQPW